MHVKMNPRARELIGALELQPHPEGGHFREVFRSPIVVQQAGPPARSRSSLTTIYFLLAAGEHSRWHRVASDEAWHYYEGDPLELVWVDAAAQPSIHTVRLHAASADAAPVAVVPAGCWQAARPLGAYTLVGCSVGPGFDFADFELLASGHERERLRRGFERARDFE